MSEEITWWVAPDGSTTQLDVDWSASGRFMPAIQHQEQAVPGVDGTTLYNTLFNAHEFTLPIWLYGDTDAELRVAMRELTYSMSPKRGMGRIRVQSVLGDQREIWCRVSDGLGFDESEGNSGLTSQKAAVLFHAFDPLWYDVNATTQTWSTTVVPTFFPIFPLRLTASALAISANIYNSGDEQTWPVWTIQGPASGIQLQNLTTGLKLSLTGLTLSSSQQLIVDTRQGQKTVQLQDGTNCFPLLDRTSAFWPLVEGNNAINLVAGGTTPASYLQVNYWQTYLSP